MSIFLPNLDKPHSLCAHEYYHKRKTDASEANLRFIYGGGPEALTKLRLQQNVLCVLGDAEPIIPVQSILKGTATLTDTIKTKNRCVT